MVKEATGRELNLGGEINLAVGFSPALVVTDNTLANASWGSQPQMVKIDELQAQVGLLPLLARDVKLRYIGLRGVDVLLETDKTGHANWYFSPKDSSAGKTGTFKLHNLDIDKIRIDKLEATYKETKISGNLHIDPGSPPQVATNFLVQGLNLGEFLKESGKSDQVRGIVDIAAHGKSSGDSVSSLMAHLDGAFGAVMGPGYLTKYLDLLSMDLFTKIIPFWGRNKKADEINCAVVQFDIKKGVAVSKAFVFDSQNWGFPGELPIFFLTGSVEPIRVLHRRWSAYT